MWLGGYLWNSFLYFNIYIFSKVLRVAEDCCVVQATFKQQCICLLLLALACIVKGNSVATAKYHFSDSRLTMQEIQAHIDDKWISLFPIYCKCNRAEWDLKMSSH